MDRQAIIEKLSRRELCLKDLPQEARADPECVLAEMAKDPDSLKHASDSLRGDARFLGQVAKRHGTWVLRHAADTFDGSRAFAEEWLFARPACFPNVARWLEPTPEVLDAAFGGHDLASLRAHPNNYATDDGERFIDELDDAQDLNGWATGESRDVGNGVTIQCWHEATEADHVLKFFVLSFQAETVCLAFGGTLWRDPCDPDCAGLTDLLAVFCFEGEVSPIGDNQHYFEFLCDLEDPDSLDGYVEERPTDHKGEG